ncbi:MAG TPA: glutamate--tRNA ligase family protein, partial [Arenimonas sp.]|nr:glutamate--tRNA ligase family protein [Arenimonas sp.]
ALQRLLGNGHAFACRCSRRDLEANDGRHLGPCVNDDPLRPTSIRLRVTEQLIAFDDRLQGAQQQNLRRDVGDVVLRRSDGLWAYQLAVVVDDHAQGITDVVRGADLLDSTPRQIWLQRCLGIASPEYLHLPLLLDAQGRKLSKSLAALPIDPAHPLPALNRVWQLLGQSPTLPETGCSAEYWLRSALEIFDPSRLPASLPEGASATIPDA